MRAQGKTHHDDDHRFQPRRRTRPFPRAPALRRPVAVRQSLRQQLGEHLQKTPGAAPSHVQLLNMLARAAGRRSVQALRAQATPRPAAAAAAAALRVPWARMPPRP
ncbi:MAG: hypothetical protein U1F53_17975 [Burkholderiaceae bacterium]